MNKKISLATVTLAFIMLVCWIVIKTKRENEFKKESPVIQAVSEIEKNLNEADKKAK